MLSDQVSLHLWSVICTHTTVFTLSIISSAFEFVPYHLILKLIEKLEIQTIYCY